jgi:predicted transcriptional regulator
MRSQYLSKREQQIMDLVHERGEVTATELEAQLPGEPSNATVRTHLRILERKGHLIHREEAGRFVYTATQARDVEGRSALRALVQTFFGGSVSNVVSTLLDEEKDRLSDKELADLQRLVDEARKEGR